MKKVGVLILGDQLFEAWISAPPISLAANTPVFMAEDHGLITRHKIHQQKIVLFLSAMRHFAERIKKIADLKYFFSDSKVTYQDRLRAWIKHHKITELHHFDISDRQFRELIAKTLVSLGVTGVIHPSPGFLTSRKEFSTYLGQTKKPLMKTFYEKQRKSSLILMEKSGDPVGGQFSFDQENRKPLPQNVSPPPAVAFAHSSITREVIAEVSEKYPDHPGNAAQFAYAATHADARRQLEQFVLERLDLFGPYEDAITMRSDQVFHSVLTPYLNMGLITPKEVLDRVLQAHKKNKAPIASVEGYVRQVMGWREFIKGMNDHYESEFLMRNFFNHTRKLKPCWWEGTTRNPVLDHVIKKVVATGYAHHIERLMVAGNLMTLARVQPLNAYQWFMDMFIDSAEWVMAPNVMGMGIFSDGGIFATKPYISGSNYIFKMSDFKKPKSPGGSGSDWALEWDGLYWKFIHDHVDFFAKNPRLSMMSRTLEKMDSQKKEQLFGAASQFIERTTTN